MLRLSLGSVSAADQTFIHGVQIGATGIIGSPYCKDYLPLRSYIVPPGLLTPAGDNAIPVRVYSQGGDNSGGLYDSCAADAYDAGASPGQGQRGLCRGRRLLPQALPADL